MVLIEALKSNEKYKDLKETKIICWLLENCLCIIAIKKLNLN